jgi:hypothetical protein
VGGAPAPLARTISDAPIATINDKAPTLIAFKKIDFIELLLLECLEYSNRLNVPCEA